MWDEHADCPSDAFYGLPVQPVVGNMSFHTVATITSAACTILAILLGLILAMSHLTRYTKREEQRQLVRIAVVPAIISIFCFFGIWFNSTSGFLKPIGEYYESIALVAIFLLFLTFATPMQERGHSNFSNIENLQERNGGGLLSTYYMRWFLVFQIIPVRFITLIATLAVSGPECHLLKPSSNAHTIIQAIGTVSTIICFISILKIHKFLKPTIDIPSEHRKPMTKLLALKLLVFLDVMQTLIFNILLTTNTIKPTSVLSLPDLVIGVPGLMVCIECFLFSSLFFWAYTAAPYKVKEFETERGVTYTGKASFFAAVIDVFDIRDILGGILDMFNAFRGWRSGAQGAESEWDGVYQRYPDGRGGGYRK